MTRSISDADLNAFLDGELESEEREAVRDAIRRDPELAREIQDLEQVGDWVRMAYQEPTPARRPTGVFDQSRGPAWPGRSLAAGFSMLTLAVGLTGGWLAHDVWSPSQEHVLELASDTDMQALVADHRRVVLHLDSASNQSMHRVLTQAEAMLEAADARGQEFMVRVVANAQGLDLLRADVSPHVQRVQQMMERHPNLDFVACNNTLQRLREQGVSPELVPNTKVAPSAIAEVVNRLDEGWSYIRI